MELPWCLTKFAADDGSIFDLRSFQKVCSIQLNYGFWSSAVRETRPKICAIFLSSLLIQRVARTRWHKDWKLFRSVYFATCVSCSAMKFSDVKKFISYRDNLSEFSSVNFQAMSAVCFPKTTLPFLQKPTVSSPVVPCIFSKHILVVFVCQPGKRNFLPSSLWRRKNDVSSPLNLSHEQNLGFGPMI